MTEPKQRLVEGPIDIIGDVHGEAGALRDLLGRLGCDPDQGTAARPIAFVGDLVDRGPDSPAVVDIVMKLVEAGIAQCVLGNHELNILLGLKKEGNGWFWGDATDDHQMMVDGRVVKHRFDSVLASSAQAERYRAFFASLPLVLARDDLRVVHACWSDAAVDQLPHAGAAADIGRQWSKSIHTTLKAEGLWEAERQERKDFAELNRLDVRPDRDLPAHATSVERRQNNHPVKVLTSGLEVRIPLEQIFFVGGKWRFCRRHDWWNHYEATPAVVVGHYWRQRARVATDKPDRWETARFTDWTGPRSNVFCVDYSVGKRFVSRALGVSGDFPQGLAALRWPERLLVFDDRAEPVPTTGFAGT
jgi:hypothetical protein